MTETSEPRHPVAEYLAANRKPFAVALLAVGIAAMLAGLASFAWKFGVEKAVATAPAEKEKEKGALPDESVETEKMQAEGSKADFMIAGVLFVFAGACLALVGVWVMNRPPGNLILSDARTAALAAGGAFGFFLMVLGLWLIYSWFQPLTDWLEKGDRRGAKWPVLAVAVFVAGGALAFFSAQPARAEERTNPQLRRLVYGFNLVLSTLLLVVLLAAVNVFISLRVPNLMDTTEGGFYTFELSEATKDYLGKLDRPVTAYVTITRSADDHITRETFRLLEACAAANPDRFKVRPIGQGDREEYLRLAGKFPQSGLRDEPGILLVAGEDESESAFIREGDLADSKSGRGRDTFQGEARLARELLFLAEGKQKAVAYFTTGNGELSVTPGEKSARTANRLRTYVERNNVEVKPLVAGLDAVEIPADAAMVVVADPTSPLPDKLVSAIQKYLTTANKKGKKGKLILIAGPHPKLGGKGVAATGLEPILAEVGITLDPGYLYGYLERTIPLQFSIGAPNEELADRRHPLALSITAPVAFPNARVVAAATPPGAPLNATPLLLTPPGAVTWIDPEMNADPMATYQQMAKNPNARIGRQLSQAPRGLAAVVSEGDVSRIVVFGSGDMFLDRSPVGSSPVPAELFANTVDWLRDRPAVANIANKTYGVYTPKPDGGWFRGEVLPVLLVLFAIVALGTGVWVTRRK